MGGFGLFVTVLFLFAILLVFMSIKSGAARHGIHGRAIWQIYRYLDAGFEYHHSLSWTGSAAG